MRCLALAEELCRRGVEILFVSREHPGNLNVLIEKRGFRVARLPVVEGENDSSPAHAPWLGAYARTDAMQTRDALNKSGSTDWLVVDHYALDASWESGLRKSAGHIMVIDDLADRKHDCDILLDQNLVAGEDRYRDRLPEKSSLLLGPRYALLQPLYAQLHHQVFPRKGVIRRILVFFGGVDRYDMTSRALNAFLLLKRADIQVDVVIASGSPNHDSVYDLAKNHPNIQVHSDLPSLAPLMKDADLAIGAGGATNWERLCLGLPALVVTLADNQVPIAEELNRHGLARWLGHHDAVSEEKIRVALEELLHYGLDEAWSRSCLASVDGEGANRVCAALLSGPATPLQIREVRADDEALLLEWANDAETRKNAFSTGPIPAEDHHAWLGKRIGRPDECCFYIVETTDGVPVGQVRFERKADSWDVDYALAPVFRGRGLGAPLLKIAMHKLGNNRVVSAQVKRKNIASQKVFVSLGFDVVVNKEDIVEYRRQC